MDMKETKEFLRRETELNDLKKVMEIPEGRRFIWRILGDAGVFQPSFRAGSPDLTAFNEGARNNGLTLLTEIMNNVPGSFLIMQKEAIDEQERQKAFNNRAGGGDDDDGRG
jgi:hypothetical protein